MKTKTTLLVMLFACSTLFAQTDSAKNTFSLALLPSIGAGLVRHTLAPSVYANLIFTHKNSWQLRLNTASYFFFEPTLQPDNTRNYKMHINTFVNTEFLIHGLYKNKNGDSEDWNGLGAGYLIGQNGNYFSGSTAKLYYINKFRRIAVMPEIIFTNNFKTVFPGVTIRF